MEWLLLLLFSSFHSLFLLFSCFKRWKVLKKIYKYFVRFTLSKFCCLFDLFSLFHRNNLEVWWWWRWRVERRFYKLTLLPAYLLLLLSLKNFLFGLLLVCLSLIDFSFFPFSLFSRKTCTLTFLQYLQHWLALLGLKLWSIIHALFGALVMLPFCRRLVFDLVFAKVIQEQYSNTFLPYHITHVSGDSK